MSEDGRLKMSLEKFIEQTIPDLDYRTQYEGTIIAQSGQTFDFLPDDTDVPGIKGLAFYSGPGISITVDPTKQPRAVLFFPGADPSNPKLGLLGNPGLVTFYLTATQEIDILAPTVKVGTNATLAAARATDPILGSADLLTWFGHVAAALSTLGKPAPVPPSLASQIGSVKSGSAEVKVG